MKNDFMFGIYCDNTDIQRKSAIKQMHEAGIEWIRTQIPGFPFRKPEKLEFTDSFLAFTKMIKNLRTNGFKILLITFFPSQIPESFGTYGSRKYYQNCENVCRFLAQYFERDVQYWKIANEMNLEMFRKPLTIDEAIRFLKVCGRGIKKGNPSAKVCVNMADFDETALYMYKKVYCGKKVIFDYVGANGYFGSWHPGGPHSWATVLEELYKLTKKPIVIQEWGYSSKGDFTTEEERSTGVYPCKLKKWWYKWKDGHSEKEQAKYIVEAMNVFLSKHYVIGAFYFMWSDRERCWQCGSPDCPVETGWGLVDTKGNPKPSYYAYQNVIQSFEQTSSRRNCFKD
ncbi:glycosyl hydrolase 53 family protein [Candidatus Bathyarchaeota archaeon]|nr:glycosyl hydrolase 53 family protein [Candidatus Bathyarchaeota archaeon]